MSPRRIGQHCLCAAAPTPIDSGGELHVDGLRRLVQSLDESNLGGVAIGTPLGRGSRLTSDQWSRLISTWRDGLGDEKILIASVGPAPQIRRPGEVVQSALDQAQEAARLGADALLVQPPGAVRGRPDRDRLILEYHAALSEAGLPMLISYRRESSGGISYGPEVLAQLLARPDILGIEIATIDGITTFQQVEALVREIAPEKWVVSGEERFLGYSLLSGADAAIVGIASAYPAIVGGLFDAHRSGDAPQFLSRTVEVDTLARPIFRAPLEGSTRRLLAALVANGTIPADAAFDPWGPQTGRGPSF